MIGLKIATSMPNRRANRSSHDRGIIEDGVEAGEFDVPDVPGTTLAVLSLCIDVARWFNVNGSRTPDEVGALYADLVLRMVGAEPVPAGNGS